MAEDDAEPRTFDSALQALYSDDHIGKTQEAIKRSACRRRETLADMAEYMDRTGLRESAGTDHPTMILHIAGTKGKGSVACMCERILRQHNYRTGLFTSPHLVDIRERIRINGLPISRKIFGETYWTLRKRLEEHGNASVDGEDSLPTLPGYFRMLTLMAMFVFIHYEAPNTQEKVTYWILEVGMGGRYDATKAFYHSLNPAWPTSTRIACGVTLIDYDHIRVLGNTLEEIAWEKGGILDVPSTHRFLLDSNSPAVLRVLRECAGTNVTTVGRPDRVARSVQLGLQGDHQYTNAEMAVALCEAVCDGMDATWVQQALETATWPGRCQSIPYAPDPQTSIRLHLDGAHTVESIRSGMKWFSSCGCARRSTKVLLFYCGHEKDPVQLFQEVIDFDFDLVIFAKATTGRPSAESKPSAAKLLSSISAALPVQDEDLSKVDDCWETTLYKVWKAVYSRRPNTKQQAVEVCTTLEVALDRIRQASATTDVFATGSLYLVGSILQTVGWAEQETFGSLRYRDV